MKSEKACEKRNILQSDMYTDLKQTLHKDIMFVATSGHSQKMDSSEKNSRKRKRQTTVVRSGVSFFKG